MIKPTLYHQGDQNLVYTVQKTTLDHKEHICLWTPKTRLFQTVLRQKKIAVLVHIFFKILFITMLIALLLLNKMVYFFKGQVQGICRIKFVVLRFRATRIAIICRLLTIYPLSMGLLRMLLLRMHIEYNSFMPVSIVQL